jgi:hypothetical protein
MHLGLGWVGAHQHRCNIENKSEEGFSRVSVELKRRLTLRDNRGGRHYSEDVVARQDYAGVGANEVRGAANPLSLPLNLNGVLSPPACPPQPALAPAPI